ncbi:MAG: LamG domain-containing protein, partial [Bacteroidota bacterium]
MRGQADLGFLSMNGAFGMAAGKGMGFQTGFKLNAKLLNAIDAELKGAVALNAPVAGQTSALPSGQAAQQGSGAAQTPVQPQIALPTSNSIGVQGTKVLRLSGNQSRIVIPNDPKTKINAYTAEIWVKVTNTNHWMSLFGKPGRNFCIFLNPNGYIHHRFAVPGNFNHGAVDTPNGSFKFGEWQHVAITNDGSTARTYINGELLSETPFSGGLVLADGGINMGYLLDGTDINHDVTPMDILTARLWKVVRTQEQIKADMYKTLVGAEKDLVALFVFNKDTGNVADDLTGSNDGTIFGGTWVESDFQLESPNVVDKAFAFNGVNTSMNIPHTAAMPVNAYTVETWIKVPKPTHVWNDIFIKYPRDFALVIQDNGRIYHRFNTANNWNEGGGMDGHYFIQWDTWTHVAITNDGKNAAIYLNGELKGSTTYNSPLKVHSGELLLGHTTKLPNNNRQFQLQQMRIWKVVRSQADIKRDMHKAFSGMEVGLS